MTAPVESRDVLRPAAPALIDTHVHVWDVSDRHYPWLAASPAELASPARPSEVERVESGTTARILVEAGADPAVAFEEASWLETVAVERADVVGVIAAADLAAAAVQDSLDRLLTLSHLVGVRHPLQGAATAALRDPSLHDGLAELAARGLAFDACVEHRQLPDLIGVLQAVPELTVVLDHLGKPPVDAGFRAPAARQWTSAMAELAQLPNVRVKLSGLSAELRSTPAARALDACAPFLDHAVEVFGAERAMVGSDWPVSARTGARLSFATWLEFLDRGLAPSAEEWAWISFRTASAAYGVPLDSSASPPPPAS